MEAIGHADVLLTRKNWELAARIEHAAPARSSQSLTRLPLNLPLRPPACNVFMEKAIHSPEYRTFLRVLRKTREELGVTQVELADRLSKQHSTITQSLVSKLERGEVRLDVVQLRWICGALGMTLIEFVGRLEAALPSRGRR